MNLKARRPFNLHQ